MGGRRTAMHMMVLVCVLTLSICAKGDDDTKLQSRMERLLQEAFQPGAIFGGNPGGSSPTPGPPQSLTPIPRDSSLAKAVLTGQGPGRRLMSFAAMRPLYTSASGDAADVGEGKQGMVLRQRPYLRSLLQRLLCRTPAEGGPTLEVGQGSGAHQWSLQVLR